MPLGQDEAIELKEHLGRLREKRKPSQHGSGGNYQQDLAECGSVIQRIKEDGDAKTMDHAVILRDALLLKQDLLDDALAERMRCCEFHILLAHACTHHTYPILPHKLLLPIFHAHSSGRIKGM